MNDQKLTLLERLQDNNYALYFAIITCCALAPNSYYMFHEFSVIPETFLAREIQAAVVALIIAGSILYYTAKKNLKYADIFAKFEFFISCCYYFHSLIMKDGQMVWNWHIIPAIAFAYMLPWSVKGYASSIDYDQIPGRGAKGKAEPLFSKQELDELAKPFSIKPIEYSSVQQPVLTIEEIAMIKNLVTASKQPEQTEKPLSETPTEELLKEAEAQTANEDDLDNIFEKGAQISAIK